MLIVIEGQSAVGKTTFLAPLPPEQVVAEEVLQIPASAGPLEALPYGVELNTRRWKRLVEAEARYGRAYADSDPLKLYYGFALVSVGELPREVFDEGWRLSAQAVAERKQGLVDHVVFLSAPPEKLAERKSGDASRRRGKFALHVRLGPAMEAYYAALERLRPGTVRWMDASGDIRGDATTLLTDLQSRGYERYDTAVLVELKRSLDRLLDGHHS